MLLEELQKELVRGVLHPVYLLLGPEEHLRRRAVELLRKKAVADEGLAFNFSIFEAGSAPMADAVAAANTFPLGSRHRIVVVMGMEALPADEAAVLQAYVEKPQSKTVLLLSAAEMDRRSALYRRLAETAAVVELPKLKAFELERWAEERLRQAGLRISPSAVRKLVDLAGADLDTLSQEVDKLALYCAGQKAIPDSAVDTLVRGSRQRSIFELTRAIGKRDRPQALRVLGSLIEAGEHPLMIVTMLARHFRQVLIAREMTQQGRSPGEIASAAQIPGFLRDEFLGQVRALAPGLAERMYLLLADADRRFKSTSADERMFLERLITAL